MVGRFLLPSPSRQDTTWPAKGVFALLYVVHTGNRGLAASLIPAHGHNGDAVPVALDDTVPDHQWRLYCDDLPATHLRPITLHVATEIREAIAGHQKRTGR